MVRAHIVAVDLRRPDLRRPFSRRFASRLKGQTVIALEDFKVQPGDVVSMYATASDARSTSKTDIFFIEAQPFERNYTQSQQEGGGGGGGGGGDDQQQNQISQRQKEINTATWNQLKGQGARGSEAENAQPKNGRHQISAPTQVTKQQWEKLVGAQMQVAVSKDGKPGEPEKFAENDACKDSWTRWNRERDGEPCPK